MKLTRIIAFTSLIIISVLVFTPSMNIEDDSLKDNRLEKANQKLIEGEGESNTSNLTGVTPRTYFEKYNISAAGEGVQVAFIGRSLNFTEPHWGDCNETKFNNGSCEEFSTTYFDAFDYVRPNNTEPYYNESTPYYIESLTPGNWHGEAVASIVNANSSKFKGAAYKSKLQVYKAVLGDAYPENDDEGGFGTDTFMEGLARSAENGARFGVVSWGVGYKKEYFKSEMERIEDTNIRIFQSVGNLGPDYATIANPLSMGDNIVAVGAANQNGTMADYSSTGPIFVGSKGNSSNKFVPRFSARSNWTAANETFPGTSASAPYAASVAATYASKYPNRSQERIVWGMISSTSEMDAAPLQAGTGFMNVSRFFRHDTTVIPQNSALHHLNGQYNNSGRFVYEVTNYGDNSATYDLSVETIVNERWNTFNNIDPQNSISGSDDKPITRKPNISASVEQDNITVPAGGKKNFTVRFNQSGLGVTQGYIELHSNDTTLNEYRSVFATFTESGHEEILRNDRVMSYENATANISHIVKVNRFEPTDNYPNAKVNNSDWDSATQSWSLMKLQDNEYVSGDSPISGWTDQGGSNGIESINTTSGYFNYSTKIRWQEDYRDPRGLIGDYWMITRTPMFCSCQWHHGEFRTNHTVTVKDMTSPNFSRLSDFTPNKSRTKDVNLSYSLTDNVGLTDHNVSISGNETNLSNSGGNYIQNYEIDYGRNKFNLEYDDRSNDNFTKSFIYYRYRKLASNDTWGKDKFVREPSVDVDINSNNTEVIPNITYRIDKGNWKTVSARNTSLTIDQEGNHSLEYYTSYYNDSESSNTEYVAIDAESPSVGYNPSSTSEGSQEENYIFVNSTASDGVNLSSVNVVLDGATYSLNEKNGYYVRNFTGLSDGDHSYRISAEDHIGNLASTSERTVSIGDIVSGYVVKGISSEGAASLFDSPNTNLSSSEQEGVQQVVVGNGLGKDLAADFEINFTQNISLSDLDFDSNFSNGKSFVHNTDTVSNLLSKSLLIPRLSDSDKVRICPGASSFSAVSVNCSNGYNLSTGETVNGVYLETVTISDQNYYRAVGISGTGGLEISSGSSSSGSGAGFIGGGSGAISGSSISVSGLDFASGYNVSKSKTLDIEVSSSEVDSLGFELDQTRGCEYFGFTTDGEMEEGVKSKYVDVVSGSASVEVLFSGVGNSSVSDLSCDLSISSGGSKVETVSLRWSSRKLFSLRNILLISGILAVSYLFYRFRYMF